MLKENMVWFGKSSITAGIFEYDVDEGLFYLMKKFGGLYYKRIKIAGGNWDSIIKSAIVKKVSLPTIGFIDKEIMCIPFDLVEMQPYYGELPINLIAELEDAKKGMNLMFKKKILAEQRAEEFSSKTLIYDEQKKISDQIKRVSPYMKGGN